MATVVELPRLSDTMEEGVVARWRIKVGDKVKRGQVIAEIETDKATMEFESFDAGTVLALVASEGQTLALGAPIAVLGQEGEDPQAALRARGNGKAAASPPPAAASAPAEGSGPAEEPTPNDPAPAEAAPAAAPAPAPVLEPAPARIPASPVARKLAREHDLDLGRVTGSGPHGRVIKADVERALGGGRGTAGATALGQARGPVVRRPDTLLPHSQMRKTVAKRMAISKPGAPHFYLTMRVRMDEAAAVRGQYNELIEGTKVSVNDMIVAAAARALRDHPECNVNWTPEGMTRYGNVDVGVAVAVPDGLLVPVIRSADQKSLPQISIETRDLAGRARDKKLRPEEMSGSTFTVSNLGMFGISEFSAVVNPGEGAILAVGAVEETPLVVDGRVEVHRTMAMTLSCDHRAIDGATGARFLGTVRRYLEQPLRILLT